MDGRGEHEKLMGKRGARGELKRSIDEVDSPAPNSQPTKKYSLHDISRPPTNEELSNYVDMPLSDLPPKFKRDLPKRIFVNRDLRLDRIKFFGFDMDYTLAIYKSPAFEELQYTMAIQRMIKIGYPESIGTLKYDPSFPIRGLFLDKDLGNLLKIDSFGNITFCVHGKRNFTKHEIITYYPSMVIHNEDIGGRFYLLNTLFALPEACLYSDLVHHLEKNSVISVGDEVAEEEELDEAPPRATEHPEPVPQSDVSYANLFQDVRNSMDFIHADGSLKTIVLDDLPKYIEEVQLKELLGRIHQKGGTCFLLTNSEYYYTDRVMKYLLKEEDWKKYWDIIIVGANKPQFFGGGTTLREVDLTTGNLKITPIGEKFIAGKVYHGGSMSLFQKMTGAKGSSVLYTGDHIFADIIKSKKIHGWRNLLVVPELHHELAVWEQNQTKYNHLINLEFIKAEMFRDLDSSDKNPPDMKVLREHIKKTNSDVNEAFNKYFGSLFRSGSKPSFFAMQVQRYADLYTADFYNLLNYPLFYEFSPNSSLLPHEYHPVAELAQSMS